MRTKTKSLILALVILGTALIALAPTAQAQGSTTLTIVLSSPGQQVKPLQGSISFQGTATFVAESTAQSSFTGVQITYSVKSAPAWASVTISPQTDVFTFGSTPTPGATVTGTKTFSVTVSASDQAPAFSPGPIEIQAVTSTTPAFKAANGLGSVPIEADYFALIDLNLAEKIKVDRPQTPVIFPLTITNLGNANTKVNFELADYTQNLQVPVPDSVTLQSRQAGGSTNQQTVNLQVQTPYKNGYLNEVGVVNFKVISHYALDPKKKAPDETVSVLVTTKGFYVPGAELPAVLALLGVAALFARRRFA